MTLPMGNVSVPSGIARSLTTQPEALNSSPDPVGDQLDSRPSLLIADDDAIVRSVLSSQLQSAFRLVAIAKNADEAVQLAAEHQPDAALIDVEMPGGGARAAVPQIAACSPRTCMVVLSGDEAREIVVELLTAGAIAYIRKGVTGAQISQTLMDALGSRPPLPPA